MSAANVVSPEITYQPEHASDTKQIWKVFKLLSFLTVCELGLGLWIYNVHKGEHPSETLVLFIKGVVCILTLAKAYYIVSVFMHLGSEIRNFIMTIIVPLALFIWFIIAFLWDGDSWKHMRNTDGGIYKEQTEKVKPAAIEKGAKE